ncbi:MAG: 2-hydroxyacyl-CoA dehydratase family protein [Candidatus Helarchaeota archaeon]|nr:2-hydroxyacyl-CoA dehydratase family protein [Candidatus Helarchaeota archaeon]
MSLIQKPLLDLYIKQVQNLKRNGVKIIGFTCSYVPEEIIYAAHAFPLRLNLGGVEDIAVEGGELMSVGTCPYARSTLGYFLKNHPLYSQCDLVITGNFCNAMETIQDYAEYLKIPITNLDVPRRMDPVCNKYFYKEISLFKESIEQFCGAKISDDAIIKSIEIYNELRTQLKKINELRMQENPALTGTESLHLVQETFLSDKKEMVKKLKDVYSRLKDRHLNYNRKRVVLSGSNIAFDDEVVQTIEELNGLVVGEDSCTGMRFYWDNVELAIDPIQSLTTRYLTKIPCARMYPDSARFDFIKEISEKYHASGIINYNLKFCDPFQLKKYPLKTFVEQKLGIPILILEREYTQGDQGQIQNRIQAFLEML